MFRQMTALSLAMVLCSGSLAVAQTTAQDANPAVMSMLNKLKVGDKAPALSNEEWVKGSKVEKFEGGKVYVVEFWATWCPPCVESIPHLTKLQKQYQDKGVTVIGVASSERGATSADKLKKVKTFVEKQGSKMDYTVAFDSDRSMSNDWMQAAGQNGIPCSFVVGKDGKIAWIGHPMNGLDEAVRKAVGGGKADAGPRHTPGIQLASWQPESDKKKPAKDKEQEKDKAPTLMIGDKAPALEVDRFVKGEPVTGFEKGKTYVVEFWATWCVPCVAAIPHVSELQKEHKDKGLTVVGVNVWDDPAAVKPFVEEMGDKMDYRVALDKLPKVESKDRTAIRKAANDGKMAKNWLGAAGIDGIPAAFIVNGEGRIAWIGHPMSMDEPLEKILAGEWDLKAEAEKYRKKAMSEKEGEKVFDQFVQARQAGNTDKMLDAAAKLVEMEHPGANQAVYMAFQQILVQDKEYDRAYGFARKLMDGAASKNAEVLNSIAWTIVDPDNEDQIEKKDLDLALRAAKRADELTKNKQAHIIDTLAKVHHDRGDLRKAIELQKKAVELSADTPFEEELKQRLEEYQEKAEDDGN